MKGIFAIPPGRYLYCHLPANATGMPRSRPSTTTAPVLDAHGVLCWRSAGAGSSDANTFACSACPQPSRRQPCARVELARLWAVLDVVSIFSHDVSYTYSLPAPRYIYLLVAVRSREHDQRLKACTFSLGGQSSSHHSNVDRHSSGDQRGQRLERCERY